MDSAIARLLAKAVAGERLTPDEGLHAARVARSGGPGPGGRRGHAPAASRAVSHLQHRSQRQLHERLHGGLRFLRLLSPAQASRRLCARPRSAAAKDPGDGRSGRRSDPDARRPASRAAARVVRRTAARHQDPLSASQRPRLQPAGDSPLHQGRQAAAADGARAAQGGRAGQPARRRGRDPGRSRAPRDHPRQGA